MSIPSEVTGVHQSDLIIRSAIIAAIDDIRANPWLLDYAFASLLNDTLTAQEYGQAEVDAAKKWFLRTRIPVFMSTRVDQPSFPCISITLVDSNEAETTLADTHYVPAQDSDRTWPALTPTFVPTSWNQATGTLVVPQAIADDLVLAPGMLVQGPDGVAHEILTVVDNLTVTLAPGTPNLDRVVIKGSQPPALVDLESVRMKETYALGSHVQGEQTHLTYLHSLLVFLLYRYKKPLLEARGYERTVVSSSDFRRNDAFESELTFSRHVNLTGYVAHVWPGQEHQKITSTDTQTVIDGAGHLPPDTDPDDSLWTC